MRTGAKVELAMNILLMLVFLWAAGGCLATSFRHDATIEQPVYTPHCIHVTGGQALWRPVTDGGWKCHGEDI